MYIYLITNLINGNRYIGYKTNTPTESPMYYGSGSLLRKAIKKYGKSNFSKSILEQGISDIDTLNAREIHWIREYRTYINSNDYNLNIGGAGCRYGKQVYHDPTNSSISRVFDRDSTNIPKGWIKGDSKQTRDKKSTSISAFYKTEAGKILRSDQSNRVAKQKIGNTNSLGRKWWYHPITLERVNLKGDQKPPKDYIRGYKRTKTQTKRSVQKTTTKTTRSQRNPK